MSTLLNRLGLFFSHAVVACLALLALLGMGDGLQAATYTAVNGGGDWSSASTWSPSGVPGAADTAIINSSSFVTVSDSESVGTLTYGGSSFINISQTTGNLTIHSSATLNNGGTDVLYDPGTVTLGAGASVTSSDNSYIEVSRGFIDLGAGSSIGMTVQLYQISTFTVGTGSATVSGNIINNFEGQLDKMGAGTLILTGTDSFPGDGETPTQIFEGTLQIGNGGTSGSLTGDIVDSGTLAYDRSDSITNADVISSYGGLTQMGSGTLTLTTNETYTGATLVSAGTLAIGTGGTISNSASVAVSNGATFDISGGGAQTVQNLSGAGDVTLGSNTLTVSNNSTTTFSGVISGTGALTNTGTGTLILSGANTYTGGTTISAGTLQIGAGGATGSIVAENITDNGTLAYDRSDSITNAYVISGTGALTQKGSGTLTLTTNETYTGATLISAGTLALGTGGTISNSASLAISNAGTLDISGGGNQTVQNLTGASGSSVTLGSNTLTASNSSATTFAGAISGTGGLTENGSSTLTLSGANTYTGATTITNGILKLSGTGSIADSSSVTLQSNGALDISATTSGASVNNLSDGGTATNDSVNLVSKTLTVTNTGTNILHAIIQGSGGGLTVAGSGTLELTGANTYTGATTVAAGTLALGGTADISDSSGVVISNAGTLDISGHSGTTFVKGLTGVSGSSVTLGGNTLAINGTGTTTFAGVISGTGVFSQHGVGSTTILTGANTYTGGTTVVQGTLQIGNGGTSGSIVANISDSSGGTVAFDRSDSLTYAGTLGGSGAFQQIGTGTLILTGNSGTYSGATTVSAGTLEVDGTLGNSSSTVTVASGGSVGGSGTLGGNLIVQSGGTLAPGDPVTLNIGGNLTLNSGSSTLFQVASASNYDKVIVGGTATLGGTLYIEPVSGFSPASGETFQFITATGGVSGQFTGVTNTLGNAVNYTYTYNPANFTVTLTASQGTFTPFAQDGNQTAIAQNLDKLSSDPRAAAVLSYLNSLPGTALPAAFEQIAPTTQTVAAPIAFNDGRASFRTIDSRLSNIRGGSTGLDLTQLNFNTEDIPLTSMMAGTDGTVLTSKPFLPDPNNRWGFFASADGDFGNIDGQDGAPNSDYYGGGAQAGVDYRVNRSFAIGFQAGYNKDKDDFSNTSDISADTVRFGPYATWHNQTGDWVNTQIGGAYHWYDSQRDSLGGTASGNDTGTEFDASAKYGHDFKLGQWTLTPSFGFDYILLDTDAFNETGSLTPLSIASQETESLQSALGGTAAYNFQWKGIQWAPYIQAGWNHEFLNTGAAATARFTSGAGGLFTVNGYDVGRESSTFGAGLQAILTKTVTATLGYSGQANSDFLDNAFQAGVRWQF